MLERLAIASFHPWKILLLHVETRSHHDYDPSVLSEVWIDPVAEENFHGEPDRRAIHERGNDGLRPTNR